MSREVRKVPLNWQHPTDNGGQYVPLFDGADYESQVLSWDECAAKWEDGLREDHKGGWVPVEDKYAGMPYIKWAGNRPNSDDYMPRWTPAEATHLMMYESTSEGTPISPAFATPEELAHWLVDNNAGAIGYTTTASYEGWLRVARGGYAPSAVYSNATGMVSGVDALRNLNDAEGPLINRAANSNTPGVEP